MKNIILGLILTTLLVQSAGAQTSAPPDLNILQRSGFIMGPGNGSAPIHSSWANLTSVMERLDIYDQLVDQIQGIICSSDRNKGVLLIGEPSDTFRFVFARLATKRPTVTCPSLWHAEIDINKIEAGHKYVGEVEQYWEDNVRKPANGKDVVLYFRSLGRLIGLGSHSNDSTGIESEYSSNITSGDIRTVAYISKYEFNQLIFSEHAYVLNSFGLKVNIEQLIEAQVARLVQAYLSVHAPNLSLNPKEAGYLYRTASYFQPNKEEPIRSMDIIYALIRKFGSGTFTEKKTAASVESGHPYTGGLNQAFNLEFLGSQEIQLIFDSFDTEANYDVLTIQNTATNEIYDKFSGVLGSFKSRFYPTDKLKLTFTTDADGARQGFKISSVVLRNKSSEKHEITREELRATLFKLIQIPSWLVDRDFKVINELQGKLDGDVVGVLEGKKDLVKLAKVGYVAGRTDEKPVATVLLAGPTGTGKSYIAKKFAEFLDIKLITLDMTSFKSEASVDRFLDIMSNNLTLYPFAVYLFEEIDKAGREVLDRLYFMMDEGIFYDKYQRPLFARGAFVMMSTNAGAEVIIKEKNNPDLRKLVNLELQKVFRDSFLNRFDAISLFMPFSDSEFFQLAKTMAAKKISKLKEMFDWTVTADEATVRFISEKGKSAMYGARPMERMVESTFGFGLAEFQLKYGALPAGSIIEIRKIEGDNRFRATSGGKSVDYTADASNNSGMGFDFNQFFKSIRMY